MNYELFLLGKTHLKACGFRSKHIFMAFWRSSSFSNVLKHSLQLQLEQNSPLAKQSQYSFKHCDFVQLQCFRRMPIIKNKYFDSKLKNPCENRKSQHGLNQCVNNMGYVPSIGSGEGNFKVEYIKFDWFGSGDFDLRSVLKLYVRATENFLGALDGDSGSSFVSVISKDSL